MDAINSQLVAGITADTLFGTVGSIMPFIIAMCIFSFGWYVARKAIKGAAKGKARV